FVVPRLFLLSALFALCFRLLQSAWVHNHCASLCIGLLRYTKCLANSITTTHHSMPRKPYVSSSFQLFLLHLSHSFGFSTFQSRPICSIRICLFASTLVASEDGPST